jgi:hypothetical protein
MYSFAGESLGFAFFSITKLVHDSPAAKGKAAIIVSSP